MEQDTRSRRVFSVCLDCGYKSEGVYLRCPKCGGLVRLEYEEPRWSIDRKVPSMWRYTSLLPLFTARVTHGEGFTPTRKVSSTVYVKLEDRNPTGSYADRASSIVASYFKSHGVQGEVSISYHEDFTLSLVYYAHKHVVKSRVFISDPLRVNPVDVVVLSRLGALIEFTSNSQGLDYVNALTIEGLKTIAFEVIERGLRVENIIVPSESGLLAYSILKGLREAEEAGIKHSYNIIAVVLNDNTLPPLFRYTSGSVRVVKVEAREVVKAMIKLARMGIWVKPLSAAALAEAENRGSSLAILTSSLKRSLLMPLDSSRVSRLGEQVLSALKSLGEATAYEIWEALRREPSLRGVYKALQLLERSSKVCVKYRVKGGRRVRVYTLC